MKCFDLIGSLINNELNEYNKKEKSYVVSNIVMNSNPIILVYYALNSSIRTSVGNIVVETDYYIDFRVDWNLEIFHIPILIL